MHPANEGSLNVIRAEDVRWRTFAPFPEGAELAVLVGDPTKPAPFVIRVRVAGDVRMMPHRHAEDRVYTVIAGVFYIGVGEVFDESRLTAHGPGTVLVLAAGTPHFHWARSGQYVAQVSAVGPLAFEYVDSGHDPRVAAPRLLHLHPEPAQTGRQECSASWDSTVGIGGSTQPAPPGSHMQRPRQGMSYVRCRLHQKTKCDGSHVITRARG